MADFLGERLVGSMSEGSCAGSKLGAPKQGKIRSVLGARSCPRGAGRLCLGARHHSSAPPTPSYSEMLCISTQRPYKTKQNREPTIYKGKLQGGKAYCSLQRGYSSSCMSSNTPGFVCVTCRHQQGGRDKKTKRKKNKLNKK